MAECVLGVQFVGCLAAGAAYLAFSFSHGSKSEESSEDKLHSEYCSLPKPSQVVVNDSEAWVAVWEEPDEPEELLVAKRSPSSVVECLICADRDADAVLLPCGHSRVCYGCALEVLSAKNACPVCRKSVDQVVIYDPYAPSVDNAGRKRFRIVGPNGRAWSSSSSSSSSSSHRVTCGYAPNQDLARETSCGYKLCCGSSESGSTLRREVA
ncbi:hypothetical protein CTAYLR_008430 [Chrysophaeum taylorii]|uniref:RING-type domain-containing protein n=1 Tax=Chrysophaeum taylorii TaxID=2483200 RepID=A0AAD7UK99_9STRA|nr:hypothetical protein CTAYLR_008430 [Chrysophaeum taylorii]